MNNTLIDNSTDVLRMVSVLKQCISNNAHTEIMIATGYWDIPGMALIYDELKLFLERNNTKFRLIIGKEPMVRLYQQQVPNKRDDFPGEYLRKDINELALNEEYQKVVDLLLSYCSEDNDNSKLQIRIYGQGKNEKFLHAKCYIFKGTSKAYGLIGSSNFTQKGLEGNAELNYLETDSLRVATTQVAVSNTKSHMMWFEEKWEQSEAWNQTFLEEILKLSPIGIKVMEEKEPKDTTELTPHDAYIKFLQNVWGDVLDSDWQKNPEKFFPVDPTFKTLQYQMDAVNHGFSIMKKHGGFILADVVGLGKTDGSPLIIYLRLFRSQVHLFSWLSKYIRYEVSLTMRN